MATPRKAQKPRKHQIVLKRTGPSDFGEPTMFWFRIEGGNGEIMCYGELRKGRKALRTDVEEMIAAIQSGQFEIVDETVSTRARNA